MVSNQNSKNSINPIVNKEVITNKVNSKNKLKGDFGYARPTISCPANCKVQLSPNFKTVLGVERCETDDPTDGRCYMTCVPE